MESDAGYLQNMSDGDSMQFSYLSPSSPDLCTSVNAPIILEQNLQEPMSLNVNLNIQSESKIINTDLPKLCKRYGEKQNVDTEQFMFFKTAAEASAGTIGDSTEFNDGRYGQVQIGSRIQDVSIAMFPGDVYFGFSVKGGHDETQVPIVDHIMTGSPSDRAELEVGDEIVEVNGQVVDGCTHNQIISHIHKCIQSKQIKLRVKRNPSPRETDPITSDIDNAFVIAVDEEAKLRLDQLSALHKVKAIDICKLQDFGNNNLDHSGHESSVENADSDSGNWDTSVNPENNPNCVSDTHLDTHLDGHEQDRAQSDKQLELTQKDIPELNTYTANVTDGLYSDVDSGSNPANCDDVPVSVAMETAAIVNGYQDIKYHLAGPINGGYGDSPNMKYPVVNSRENVYEPVEVDGVQYNEEPVAHREMAIDCPPSFVGKKKEPPRYPTQPGQSFTPPNSNRKPHKGTTKVPTDLPYQAPTPHITPEEEQIQLDRIKMYQEDLRRRREEEDRINQEEEFLRTSIRGSKKLQSLEEEPRREVPVLPSGIINPNYVAEDEQETCLSGETTSKASTLPVRHHATETPVLHKPIGKEVLLTQLQHFQRKLRSIEDQKDLAFLQDLFQNPRFHHAMSTYDKVTEVRLRCGTLTPHDANSTDICKEVVDSLPKQSSNTLSQELKGLLQSPHMKNLLQCHDKIAARSSEPVNNTTEDDEREYLYERASQYGDEIKIVRLQKTADPLGATVRNDGDRVMIGRIVKGGAAEKSGLLHEGDEILEINGIDIREKSVNDVCDLMASLTGTLTFLIIPSLDQRPSSKNDSIIHIRAHFNYDPEEDLYIPCRELGISFVKGDVLHVINEEDKNWWQAYREGEEDQSLAGLIPSKSFQEQKESMKQSIVESSKEGVKKKNKCRCTRRTPKKKKKKQMYQEGGEELDAEEILTYEEVALYYPQPTRKRPIVLIGPPNVGRQELRQRLMESDSDRFAAAIPHTSRPIKDDELNGKDYHFVERHVFESDIQGHKFVEYGEYEKNFYGTSLEAIREVVNSGKMCVLNLYPQSLRVLKASDLKPYIVFIAPPNIEKLKQLRQKQGVKVTDTELIDIIEKAREMEENFGHYFDQFIMNYDLDRAYQELLTEINKLEVEPQWVPAHWVT